MALSGAQMAALATALDAELRKVEADEAAAFDAASRASALAGRKLYDVHQKRAAAVLASGDGVEYEELLRDIAAEVALPSEVLAQAARRTVTGAVAEVGGGMLDDLGGLAASTGQGWMTLLQASPLVVVGLAVLAVVLWVPRAAARSPLK